MPDQPIGPLDPTPIRVETLNEPERLVTAVTVVNSDQISPSTPGSGNDTTHLTRLKGVEHPDEIAKLLQDWQSSVTAGQPQPRYALLGTLGSGAQGVVYRIVDRDCRREIAFKTVKAREAELHELSRFVHEAQITAQLEHPGIVPVHDFGVLRDGTVFYTMKRIEGSHLGDWIAERRGQSEHRFDLLQILLRVGEAVAFAHSRGVVHRDLKPRNIMVGRYGEVLVMDWGLAKIVGHDDETTSVTSLRSDHGDDQDVHRTVIGYAVGTPAYMSPEAARGELDAIDARSDVYSLGVILYEMMVGESPYIRGNVRHTIDQVAAGRLRPFSERKLGEGGRQLAAIIRKTLAHQAKDRYQSVDDLARDLRRFLAGQSVSAYRDTWSERLGRFLRQHRRPVLATCITALVMGLGLTTWRIQISAKEASFITSAHAEAEAAISGGDLDRARSLFDQILGLRPADGRAVQRLAWTKEAIRERLATEAAEATRKRAEILYAQGKAAQAADDLAAASEAYLSSLTLVPGNTTVTAAYQETVAALAALEEERKATALAEARQVQAATMLHRAREADSAGRLNEALSLTEASLHLVTSDAARDLLRDLDQRIAVATEQQEDAVRRSEADRIAGHVRESLANNEVDQAGRFLEQMRGVDASHPGLVDLQARIDAERIRIRHRQAEALLNQAQTLLVEADRQQRLRDELGVSVQQQESNLIEHGNPEARDVLRDLETRLREATRIRSAALASALELLHRSHVLAADLPTVSAALSDYFVARMLEAEREGDSAQAEAAAAQARVFDDGRHARILAGLCRIEAGPAGDAVTIRRIVTGRDRCDEAHDEVLTLTRDAGLEVLHGRYLVTHASGVQRAIRLDRGSLHRLADLPNNEVPAGMALIPGGTIFGPDGRALREVPAFALGCTEVTCADYLLFLNDPAVRRRIAEAFNAGDLIYVPRSGPMATEPLWRSRGILGRASGTFLLELQDGSPIDGQQPVSGISFEDALAYIAWRSADGQAWRLPSRDEWMLAVQGGDGRHHPWGMNQDPGLCYSHIAAQRLHGVRSLLPVASFPRDRSVQGVYDLAGSLSEFVMDTAADASFAVLAGGNRADRQSDRFTAWSRREILRRLPSENCGFRLAIDLAASAE